MASINLPAIPKTEHSYYIDYEYQRKKYLENIFRYINWNHVITPLIDIF
jgi:superoxide dismutase